ncbi:DUF7619 domain-containing protein [Thiohalocapsa halophila]|nr:DUF11 domain-containing protein [Thiohalocapsa halophila]
MEFHRSNCAIILAPEDPSPEPAMVPSPVCAQPSRVHVFVLLVALVVSPAAARQITDQSDAAFNGSVTVDWPPAEFSPGQSTLSFQRDGVTFTLVANVRPELIRSCADVGSTFDTGLWIPSIENQGLTLTINPPVEAIGFNGYPGDGGPVGQFIGTEDSETVRLGFAQGFIGAADIGEIDAVSFALDFSFFCLTDMVFLPPATIPGGDADLQLVKTNALPTVGAAPGEAVEFRLDVDNLGPDAATSTRLLDLVPRNPLTGGSLFASADGSFDFDALASTARWSLGAVAAQDSETRSLTVTMPASRLAFSCHSRILNVATLGSDTPDSGPTNNLSTAVVLFDDPALPTREICGNNIDDDCDGRFDCADPDCDCRPALPRVGGGGGNGCNSGFPQGLVEIDGRIFGGTCGPLIDTDGDGQDEPANPAEDHACEVPRGRCGNATVPAFCCDPGTWSNPSAANLARVQSSCDVGIPGCVPRDPNYKEAQPYTNIAGYGYIGAGETITYTIHYENVGDADATDVRIIDVLDDDLDDTTLVVDDVDLAWSYDPGTRVLIWEDPLLPPSTPRSVSFSIDMRTDALPGTRAANDATIVFPTADQPRTDTNVVEHVVPDPTADLAADLSVLRCTGTGTQGEYEVALVNSGFGFAYNVTATVTGAPPSVTVHDGAVAFSHPDDPDPRTLASVIPNAVTTSHDTIRLSGSHPVDACEALDWQITWENGADEVFERVQEPAAGRTCDLNADAAVDIIDVRALLGLRNRPTDAGSVLHDLDQDGRITILDARGCVLACDRPRCAVGS